MSKAALRNKDRLPPLLYVPRAFASEAVREHVERKEAEQAQVIDEAIAAGADGRYILELLRSWTLRSYGVLGPRE